MGDRFKGVYDRRSAQVHLFERSAHGQREAIDTAVDLGDPRIEALLEQSLYYQFKDDLELIEGLGPELDLDLVHRGKMTPVFFGSAMTNFGVELFLNAFLDYALKPGPHASSKGEILADLSGVFGLCLQAASQHGPEASRSHRFCPRVLWQI